MAQDTAFLTVRELAAGYRSGAFTPLDVCRAAQERLARLEPCLNAFIDPMKDTVLRDAETATRELAEGHDRGLLHGIPVAIKDIIDVAGTFTTYATRAVAAKLAPRDAECVRRLRQAGAIPFGKTNLLEFAAGIAHPEIGQTNNPLNPKLTAGGSSGGSAAAVAAGLVPLALGTDTGGSVRAPAAYCGIVGLKPSFDALPLDGVFPLSSSLDHLGILARTSDDAALAFAAMVSAQPDPIALLSASALDARLQLEAEASADTPLEGIHLGLVKSQWYHPAVSLSVREALTSTLHCLEKAGAHVVDVDLPDPDDLAQTLLEILMPEAALSHRILKGVDESGYAPGTLQLLQAGQHFPAVDYLAARARQEALAKSLPDTLKSLDGLIAPTIPFTAPAADPALSTEGDDEIVSLSHANLTGAPSISIPCGRATGLRPVEMHSAPACPMPTGLQITAAPGSDLRLMALAARLETLLLTEAAQHG